MKEILIDNSGLPQLLQHDQGEKQSKVESQIFSSSKTLLSPVLRDSKGKHQTLANVPSIDLSLQEKVKAAEALWAMKTAGSDYSFSSSDGTLELFQKMFPCVVFNNFNEQNKSVVHNI